MSTDKRGRRSARAGVRAPVDYREPSDPAEDVSDEEAGPRDRDWDAEAGPARTKTRPATKKRKVAAKANAESPAAVVQPLPTDLSLFEICQSRPNAVRAAAQAVCQLYRDRAGVLDAVSRVLSLLVQAAGSDRALAKAQADLQVDGPLEDAVGALVEEAVREGGHTPLAGRKGATFRTAFEGLLDELVSGLFAQGSLLDDVMVPKVVATLGVLSKASITQFRLCATVAACQVMRSLCVVMGSVEEAMETAQRQLAAEEAKKGKSAARVEALQAQVDQHVETREGVGEVMEMLHKAVSGERFRDTNEDVRAMVVSAVGEWARMLPGRFLNDAYLKYLAWALSDRSAPVRRAAVGAVRALLDDPACVPPMAEFLGRFGGRIMEMTGDVDDGVVAATLRLLARMVEVQRLPASEVHGTFKLLADPDADVRAAAGALVSSSLEDLGRRAMAVGAEKAASAAKGRKGGRGAPPAPARPFSTSELQLDGLLSLLESIQDDARAAATTGHDASAADTAVVRGAVTALVPHVPALTDWTLLAGALEDEEAPWRSAKALTNLCRVVRFAVEEAASPPGARPGRGPPSKASKDAASRHRQGATTALLGPMPRLLRRFQGNADRCVALVSVLPHLKLDTFALKKEEGAYKALLGVVKDIFFKHSDPSCLAACARAVAKGATAGPASLREVAAVVRASMAEEAVAQLREAQERAGELGEEELGEAVAAEVVYEAEGSAGAVDRDPALFAMRAAAERTLAAHAAAPDAGALPVKAGALETVCRALEAMAGGRDYGPGVTRALAALMFTLLADRLGELAGQEAVERRAVRDVEDACVAAVAHLSSIVEGEACVESKAQAAQVLSDLLVLLGSPHSAVLAHDSFRGLAIPLTMSLADALWGAAEPVLAKRAPEAQGADDADDAEANPDAARLREAAAEEVEDAKCRALVPLCKLACHGMGAGPPGSDVARALAGRVLGQAACHGDRVDELLRATAKRVRAACEGPEDFARVVAAGIAVAFESCRREGRQASDRMPPLTDHVARLFHGPHASAPAMRVLVLEGINRVFPTGTLPGSAGRHEPPPGQEFLSLGVSPFVARMAAGDAGAAADLLEKRAAPYRPSETDPRWDAYFALMTALTDRHTGHRGKRFARGATRPAESEASEEEDVLDRPGTFGGTAEDLYRDSQARSGSAPRSASLAAGSRGAPRGPGTPVRRPVAASPSIDDDDDDEEEEIEVEREGGAAGAHGGWMPRRAAGAAVDLGPSDSDEEGEERIEVDEEGDGAGVGRRARTRGGAVGAWGREASPSPPGSPGPADSDETVARKRPGRKRR